MKPAAAAQQKKNAATTGGADPRAHCLPSGVPRTNNADLTRFVQTKDMLIILVEGAPPGFRQVFMNPATKHPDPNEWIPSWMGHSIGKWQGNELIVDTIGVVPQALIAVSEAAGVPNNGDMHIRERFYLADKDILHVDLEITAPKVMTKPWKTTRIFFRQRARLYDIVEGVCLEGYFKPGVDKDGYAVYIPVQHDVGGNRVPPK